MALYNYKKFNTTQQYVEPAWTLVSQSGVKAFAPTYKRYSFSPISGTYYLDDKDWWGGNAIVQDGDSSYTMSGTKIIRDIYKPATPGATGNPNWNIPYHRYEKDKSTILSYSQGTFVADLIAEDGTYPSKGRHTDGYWYEKGSIANNPPTIQVNTTDNRTLYENDTISVSGTAIDINSGNVVNVKYQINSGTIRAITTAISTGQAIPFNKVLTFKNKALYDGSTAVTDALAEGTQHVLKVWAEDDQSGKSVEVIRIFYVVPNRPASLTINPFTTTNDLINSDKITISGNVSDPDANTVTVKYKIANGSYTDVYSGSGGAFSFQVSLSALSVGTNTITVQAVDSYGAITSKTLRVTKSDNNQPLLTSVVRYKLTPPNGTAKGVVLWIQREVGDLIVDAEISMGANGATENFVPMTKSATAFVATGLEEDEFIYENATAVENIVLKLTMTRTDVNSDKGIKLISGVLS